MQHFLYHNTNAKSDDLFTLFIYTTTWPLHYFCYCRRREDCLCTGQSLEPLVEGAPGPRREPGTFRTPRKGPDHYPSWEVFAYNATIVDVYVPREFPGFSIRNRAPPSNNQGHWQRTVGGLLYVSHTELYTPNQATCSNHVGVNTVAQDNLYNR
jgi:hypothetical protein